MATPPPGFDPNASVLPDPGASSAPIHVMRGGGMKGGNPELYKRWLSMYQLGDGQALANEFSNEEKQNFLEAMNSGKCDWTVKSTLDAKCAPLVNVLKALLKQNIKRVNTAAIPETITTEEKPKGSWFSKLTEGLQSAPKAPSAAKETPAVVKIEPVALSAARVEGRNMANTNNPLTGFSASLFENKPEENVVIDESILASTNIVNSPSNWRGNSSRRSANLKLNLTRKNKRVYSNFNINSSRTRIYGNSPSNIAKRYTIEVAKSQKLKKGIAKDEMSRVLREQEKRFRAEKEKRAETEKLIAEKRRVTAEKAAKLKASQNRAAELKAQLAAAEKEREEQEVASGLRKPSKPGLFTRAKGMWPFGKKGGRRTRRRNTRRGNRK
jgi:hypothetical protein